MLTNKAFRGIALFLGAAIVAFGCLDFGALQGGSACTDCGGDGAVGEASAPGFSIMAPASLTLQQGASTQATITIARTGGFGDVVNVTASGLPAGATTNPLTIASDTTTGSMTIAIAATTPQSLTHLSIDGVSPDGKASASATMDLIVRGPPGSLDLLYGGQGLATGFTTDFYYGPTASALDANQDLLITGIQSNGTAYNGVYTALRVLPDGTLDKTFGGGVITYPSFNGAADFVGLFPLASGEIQYAGRISGVSTTTAEFHKLTSTGAFDTSYSLDGGVGNTFNLSADSVSAFAIDATGRIYDVGGASGAPNTMYVERRFASGAPDPGFTAGTHDIGTGDTLPLGVALQSDGKIVTLAYATDGVGSGIGLARFTDTGAVDTSFGSGGNVIPQPQTLASFGVGVLLLQPDGKILVLGNVSTTALVARFNTDGSIDTTFGNDGSATPPANAYGIALQSDGKIILCGSVSVSADGGAYDIFQVERLTASGILDPTFGNNGIVQTTFLPISGGGADAFYVVVQQDGRILVVGQNQTSSTSSDFAIARYWP